MCINRDECVVSMCASVIVFVMVRVGVDGGMVIGRETIDPNLEHILLVDRQKVVSQLVDQRKMWVIVCIHVYVLWYLTFGELNKFHTYSVDYKWFSSVSLIMVHWLVRRTMFDFKHAHCNMLLHNVFILWYTWINKNKIFGLKIRT